MHQRSLEDRDDFRAEIATEFLSWDRPQDNALSYDFFSGFAEWFPGGKLSVSYNLIDRYLPQRAEHTELMSEGDDSADSKRISYAELKQHVRRTTNALNARGAMAAKSVVQ